MGNNNSKGSEKYNSKQKGSYGDKGGPGHKQNGRSQNRGLARPGSGGRAYSFVNPYNFIPLEKKTQSAESGSQENFTGVIKYSLRTVTPLFIPNTSSEDAFKMQGKCKEHKSYDFFSYKDLSVLKASAENELPCPVIPGSEMRGMLRNNYEILTNSCMSAVDDETLLSKRTQEKYQAGLLERCEKKDGAIKYRLIQVRDDCLLRTKGKNSLDDEQGCWEEIERNKGREEWGRQCYIQDSLPEGTRVSFRFERRDRGKAIALEVEKAEGKNPGCSIGYILKGEAGPKMKSPDGLPGKQNKHCAHVFREPANVENYVVEVCGAKEFEEEYLTCVLDAVLKLYDKNKEGTYQQYREEYGKFKRGEGNQFFPVYYSLLSYEENCEDSLLLSPACITREIYVRMLSDMAGDKKSCEKSGRLCPACALFGTFRKDKKSEGIVSRVRVTDLECLEKDLRKCFDKKPVTLQPLSQPKFNPEFYMKKPHKDAVFWTYDYYVDSKGRVHKNMAGVNGRKFYWHHADFRMESCTAEPSKMNKTIRPLKKGVCFKGKVFFQNLSKKELDTLCYLINAGDDGKLEDKRHGYKLGAAKPFGFGSVAMHVDEVLLRRMEKTPDEQIFLREIPYQPEKNDTLADQDVITNFEKMTDFYVLEGENVSYPRKEPNGDIFDWFEKNHKGYSYDKGTGKNKFVKMPQSRNKMLFEQYLEPMTPKTVDNQLAQKLKIPQDRRG